jgi:alanine racemase
MQSLSSGRPTRAEIDLGALRWNIAQVTRCVSPGVKILAVVKANSYGHGAVGVTKVLEKEGCAFFGVASVEEAMELRCASIKAPILVLGGIFAGDHESLLEYNLSPVVWAESQVDALERAALSRGRTLSVHVKVDTGMGRLGTTQENLKELALRLKRSPVLRLEGLMSHLSNAESVDREVTRQQLVHFRSAIGSLRELGVEPLWKHLANSAAVITWPEAHFNLVRPGLMLYGIPPSEDLKKKIDLKPVLRLRTEILQLRRVPAGFPVSYGQTFVTRRESLLATLPIGYADGYCRLLSNRGEVLVHEEKVPVVGRVCMDLTVVDVTDVARVKEGDEAVLIGVQGRGELPVEEVAKWCGTIPYEVLSTIGPRVPRVFVEMS